MVRCVYETDRVVYPNERRFIEAFEKTPEGELPLWLLEVRMSSKAEDHEMIDVCVVTDEGTFFCQVKNSAKGRSRFEERLHGRIREPEKQRRYFCIVVSANSSFQRIREETIRVLSEKRAYILKDKVRKK
ncbi:MAG: hypothetical protein HY457_03645 [Parcubacteria group bacterium]|nr:hypothetical protein [Parcubacteria group bacterium]